MGRPLLAVRISITMSVTLILAAVCLIIYWSYLLIMWSVKVFTDTHTLYDQIWVRKLLQSDAQFSASKAKTFLRNIETEIIPAAFLKNIFIAGYVIGVCLIILAGFGIKVPSTSKTYIFAYLNFILLLLAIFAKINISKESFLARSMTNALVEYRGAGDESHVGMMWNMLMQKKQCCGVYGYSDFVKKSQWPKEVKRYKYKRLQGFASMTSSAVEKFAKSLGSEGCSVTGDTINCDWMDKNEFATPIVCCTNIVDVFHGCHLKGTANSTNNNMDYGCLDALLSWWYELHGDGSIQTLFGCIVGFLLLYCVVLLVVLLEFDYKDHDDDDSDTFDMESKLSSIIDTAIDPSLLIQTIEDKQLKAAACSSISCMSSLRQRESPMGDQAVLFVTQATQTDSSLLVSIKHYIKTSQRHKTSTL